MFNFLVLIIGLLKLALFYIIEFIVKAILFILIFIVCLITAVVYPNSKINRTFIYKFATDFTYYPFTEYEKEKH